MVFEDCTRIALRCFSCYIGKRPFINLSIVPKLSSGTGLQIALAWFWPILRLRKPFMIDVVRVDVDGKPWPCLHATRYPIEVFFPEAKPTGLWEPLSGSFGYMEVLTSYMIIYILCITT